MIPKHDEFVIENGIEKNLSPLFFFQVFTAILYLHTENTQKPAVDFFWVCVLYKLSLDVLPFKRIFWTIFDL